MTDEQFEVVRKEAKIWSDERVEAAKQKFFAARDKMFEEKRKEKALRPKILRHPPGTTGDPVADFERLESKVDDLLTRASAIGFQISRLCDELGLKP